MLKPSKHLDLDRSTIRVSSVILKELRRRRVLEVDVVRRHIKLRVGDDADIILMPALSFLYLLGLLEYHVKTDSFEYIGEGAKNAA